MAKKVNSPKTAKGAKKVAKKASAGKKAVAKKADGGKKKAPKGEDLMCFLTTACVHYRGLPDDCLELRTLRDYRDQYLLQREDSRRLVAEYYVVAPVIVERIRRSRRPGSVYDYIYDRVTEACRQIGEAQPAAARSTYVGMVKKLCRNFKVQAHFF